MAYVWMCPPCLQRSFPPAAALLIEHQDRVWGPFGGWNQPSFNSAFVGRR